MEKEGILVTIPFRGTYVTQFDENDLEELYTLRSALEELAIRILMEKINSKKIRKLESIFAAMEQATHKGKVGRLIFGDMQFFIALEEHSYGGPDRLLETHYPLIEAIKKGDSSLAEKRIREHLFEALQVVKNALRKKPEGKPD
jgi:DNA-binding GntR family transcriptional regulator